MMWGRVFPGIFLGIQDTRDDLRNQTIRATKWVSRNVASLARARINNSSVPLCLREKSRL